MSRGTVLRMTGVGLITLQLEGGGYMVVTQVGGNPLTVGDLISGLPESKGRCVVFNETTRRGVRLSIDAVNATPRSVDRIMGAGGP